MFRSAKTTNLADYFAQPNLRQAAVYLYRFDKVDSVVSSFLTKYQEASKADGAILMHMPMSAGNQIANQFGTEFAIDKKFILNKLKQWLPNLIPTRYTDFAIAIYDKLTQYVQSGKSEQAAKNMFIMWLGWFKDLKFINEIGNKIPKVLFNDSPTLQELWFLNVLSFVGCDVVIILKNGNQQYLEIDKNSEFSNYWECNGNPITQNFTIGNSQVTQTTSSRPTPIPQATPRPTVSPTPIPPRQSVSSVSDQPVHIQSKYAMCTNAWLKNNDIKQIENTSRGTDINVLYNVFIQYNGVWDVQSYIQDLNTIYNKVKSRKHIIFNTQIDRPVPEETNSLKRPSITSVNTIINGLLANIQYAFSPDLQNIMQKAFADTILEESKTETNLNKINGVAITLICWLNRYKEQLYSSWHNTDIATVFFMNGCKNHNEVLFATMLSKMPIDVIILNPSKSQVETPADKSLLIDDEMKTTDVSEFPIDISNIRISTVAHNAEQELTTMLYQDTGIYRDRQFSKARSQILSTTYEEIAIYWNQEPKFRPGFDTSNGEVVIPTIFAKVSGVKDGNEKKYWNSIAELITPDTSVIVSNRSLIDISDEDKQLARLFISRDGVNRDRIKSHDTFKYGYLRDEVVELMFDKLDLLIKSKAIKGTFETGTEYDIIATILNLPKNIVRIIQAFDLTKKNPKVIYINTDESVMPIENTIIMYYLILMGFDIVFFVPTGYQNIEKYLAQPIEEHQIGQYMYDMKIPSKITSTADKLGTPPSQSKGLFGKLFG